MFVTIRAKLIGFSTLALLLMALLGGAAYYGKTQWVAANAQSQVVGSLMDSNMRLNIVQEQIRSEILLMQKGLGATDTIAYKDAVKRVKDNLATLNSIVERVAAAGEVSGKIKQTIAGVRADVVDYTKSIQVVLQSGEGSVAMMEAQFADIDSKHEKLNRDQTALNKLISDEMEAARQASEDTGTQLSSMVIALAGAALLLLSLSGYSMYRGIMRPLNELRQAIVKVEAGHYEVRIGLDNQDEIGALGRAFDKLVDVHIASLKTTAADNERLNNSVIGLFSAMGALAQKDLTVHAPVTDDIIGTLGDAINQLTDVIATVLHHVTKVAGVVEAASERMKKQSDVVNDMAKEEDVIVVRLISNLETAMASIGEVAIFARDSNRAAAEATKSTESAMETVQATLSGMNAIRETISEMEKRIKRLGERSQEISQIVNLINTISERTHVLSLNAAMQAAMAGEAGRGFAVVAEEVQRLAENSRQATGQIANLVQNIQVETNDTIATVNKTIEQVVNESELAYNAGERMRETHEATARLVRLVATIATSSAEQTKIASVLRAAADEIAQFTEKTAEQLVAQNQSAASLVAASQKLVDAISVFKLPSIEPTANASNAEDFSEQTQIFEAMR
ncbi:MAG TPA: HAMP domain-containing methyl-accepting chemotaxis protein [Gallionella sp.]